MLIVFRYRLFKASVFKMVLTDIVQTLDKSIDINYFLFCGTALGMVREGGFIAHDHDIDIAIRGHDLSALIKTMESNTNFIVWNKYPQQATTHNLTEITYIHKYLWVCVDFFLVVDVDNNRTNEWYSYGSACATQTDQRCTFSVPTIRTTYITFHGMSIPCADETFLRHHYGEDWRVPKIFTYQSGIKEGHYKSMQKK